MTDSTANRRHDDAWFTSQLWCPDCRVPLERYQGRVRCVACGLGADLDSPPLDLRPKRQTRAELTFERSFAAEPALSSVQFSKPPAFELPCRPSRDSSLLFSALADAGLATGDLLDLGCGPRDQAAIARQLGYRYIGVDLSSTHADILADAHSIPFADQSFDAVLSFAVLEHLHNPFLALTEIHRILRPGALYVGTVSLGEPFHGSFFHHSTWGLAAVAHASGLTLERIWPAQGTLEALSQMSSYGSPIRLGLRSLAALVRWLPVLTPRRWLSWTNEQRFRGECERAGSLCFVMRRARTEEPA